MNNWDKIDLNGKWQLIYMTNEEFQQKSQTISSFTDVLGYDGKQIVGNVPGNFELDLQEAGLIPDPFFGKNLLQLQKLEGCHLFYSRQFTYNSKANMIPQLVFEGIDTVSEIYLNGKLLGKTDNMFVPQEFIVKNLVEGKNEIVVHILPACIVARDNSVSAGNSASKYNYETLRLRKATHMFGWDIMPRLVSAGIFRPVYLTYQPKEHFKQAFLMTSCIDVYHHTAELELFYEANILASDLSDYSVTINGNCADNGFSQSTRLWFTSGKLKIHVDNAKLWWPKGSGEQSLYNVTIELKKGKELVDTILFKAGIRTVKLERTSITDTFFSGKFHFEVNGKRIFILGTNWVPVDAFHSRDRSRIPEILELLDDVECNCIRIWGGNLYEDEYLYSKCDEMGILIWQDFALACGVYPIDNDFCKVMEQEVRTIVRKLRNHSSILLWAGDNECDMGMKFEELYRNPNINKITRQVIPDVLAFEDPTRPYLPSSPFVDEEATGLPMEYLTENHLWGPRDYFKSNYYKNSMCNFVSEIGYHGCPSIESMSKFLSEDKMWPWKDNDEWIIHSSSPETDKSGSYVYRIELMAKQIKELFGKVPDTLENFVLASQISQAEAKKFFIEFFRTGKWNRTGIIWWNLIDGWPQFSDAVVDYFFDKKLAYHYIKRSQQPFILAFSEPDSWSCTLKAINDTGKQQEFSYTVKDYTDNNKIVLEGSGVVGDSVLSVCNIEYSQGEKKIYVIEWTCEEYSGRNHYLSGNPPFELEDYRHFLHEVYGL
ncbi:MAG TPA: sugar-binding domain-containing protein [Ruminiclostridium sp.]